MRQETMAGSMEHKSVDFSAVSQSARPMLPSLVRRLLPDGKLVGDEWVARNPTRDDRHLGSFKINIKNGRWADFATGDKGGDIVSLIAFLHGIRQIDAAHRLIEMTGVHHG
jgi:hypothetical protein